MAARPGRRQAAFVGGEIDPMLAEREELKVFSTGVAYAENIDIAPQGGFRQRTGLRDVGALQSDAARLFAFTASDGTAYDLVFRPGEFEAWSATAKLQTVSLAALQSTMLAELSDAQLLDTMLLFHPALKSKRVKCAGPTSWSVDDVPFTNLPTWDFGADIHGNPYSNGVAAVWTLFFDGLNAGDHYVLTVANIDTPALTFSATMATNATAIQTAILALPNVNAGVTAAAGTGTVAITFGGTGNLGDGWAVTGKVVDRADAAISAYKTTVGVSPGEAVISADRGWPSCGCFYAQRLLIGGFSSVPNAWMFSRLSDYFEFSTRFADAEGPALVPMDLNGGERILHMVNNAYLNIFTSAGEYWLADRAISATTPPNHVQSSANGTKGGVAVVQNEGASLYCHRDGGVLSEFGYADVDGNFRSTDISLFASSLVDDVVDMALRHGSLSTDGNQLIYIQNDGTARQVALLREQEIAAFTRLTTPQGSFLAVDVNGRNQAGFILQRPTGRRLERLEDMLLLDEAIDLTPGSATLTGLSRFNGRSGIWVIGDGDIFGPFAVASGQIVLPKVVAAATVGSWAPPIVTSLPISQQVSPGIVVKKRRRIHSVVLSVLDTTSIALSTNGGIARDIDLTRYGTPADVAELEAGYTGELKIRGLTGYAEEPCVTVTQVRPGRLNVRSITIEST